MSGWLGLYTSPLAIRCRGAFHLYSARTEPRTEASAEPRDAGGGGRLVVASAPGADRSLARQSLAKLAAAHRAISGGALPIVREEGEHDGTSFVAFEIDPVCDGESAIALLGAAKARTPYAEAIAVVDRLGRAIEAAHGARDPSTGKPCAFGGLAWANVVVATDGALHLVGLGHNVVGRDEQAVLAGTPSFFVPPELAAGGAPTPSSDAYAFIQLQRSVLSYGELPPALERVFRGEPEAEDAALVEIVRWSTERVLGAPPAERATFAELRERWEREWSLLSVRPDEGALRARLARLVATEPSVPPSAEEDGAGALVIDPDGAWIRVDGEEKRLDGRSALKRILVALVQQRLRAPGVRLDPDALLEIGWPGERPIREAGMNRVYVAVSNLRKFGLREGLQRDGEGCRIDPRVTVRFAGAGEG